MKLAIPTALVLPGSSGSRCRSPILLGYPDATLLELSDDGIRRLAYEETEQVELTKSFLDDPQRFLRHLLRD